MSTPKPRVFVSSVIEGFRAIRACARDAITKAGGEAVLVEEQGAHDASPRNACLDLVASCDAFILVIGERGGFKAPSGKTVVEEEYDEANRRKFPTLAYLQDVARDSDARALADKVSSYTGGRLRAKFKTVDDLKHLISTDLPPVIQRLRMTLTSTHQLQETLLTPMEENRGTAFVRIVIAPERSENVEQLIVRSNAKALFTFAHECDLFAFEHSKDIQELADSLRLDQHGAARGHGLLDSVILHESGLVVVESSLGMRDRERDWRSGGFLDMIIPAEQIEERVGSALKFAGLVFDRFDPHSRFSRFLLNLAILNYEGKSIERNPQPRTSFQIPMDQSRGPLSAFDAPQVASRADLSAGQQWIENAVNRIVRRRKPAR